MKTERSLLETKEEVYEVDFQLPDVVLQGHLKLPPSCKSLVIFVHGNGSNQFSPRNRLVAQMLHQSGFGTLLFDMLGVDEEQTSDVRLGHYRYDVMFLARRLVRVTEELLATDLTRSLKFGFFGSSTGAAAALVACAQLPEVIKALVSRGGRPDMAGGSLEQVQAATLFLVGGLDRAVLRLNEEAYVKLRCHKEIKILPGASHLFEEPGKLEEVGSLASEWFRRFLI